MPSNSASDLPRLAILFDQGSASSAEISRAASGLCHPIFVVDEMQAADEDYLYLLSKCGGVMVGTTPDVIARLRRAGAAGVTTFSDSRLQATAQVAAELGLPFHGIETANALAHKDMQRHRLRIAGVEDIVSVGCRDADGDRHLAGSVPLPAVVKPAESSGSRHTYAVKTPSELATALQSVLRFTTEAGSERGVIVEELLLGDPTAAGPAWGDYVSVESMTLLGGEMTHYAVVGKLPLSPPFRETGHFFPATISGLLTEDVLALTTRALHALGVRHGATHTEIKLTPTGPRIIEVNGRLGGFVGPVIEAACGLSPLRATFANALGVRLPLEAGTPSCVSFVYQPPAPSVPCMVEAVGGLDDIGSLSGVTRVQSLSWPGRRLDWRNGSASAVASVWGVVPDHARLEALVREIDSALKLDCAPMPPPDRDSGHLQQS